MSTPAALHLRVDRLQRVARARTRAAPPPRAASLHVVEQRPRARHLVAAQLDHAARAGPAARGCAAPPPPRRRGRGRARSPRGCAGDRDQHVLRLVEVARRAARGRRGAPCARITSSGTSGHLGRDRGCRRAAPAMDERSGTIATASARRGQRRRPAQAPPERGRAARRLVEPGLHARPPGARPAPAAPPSAPGSRPAGRRARAGVPLEVGTACVAGVEMRRAPRAPRRGSRAPAASRPPARASGRGRASRAHAPQPLAQPRDRAVQAALHGAQAHVQRVRDLVAGCAPRSGAARRRRAAARAASRSAAAMRCADLAARTPRSPATGSSARQRAS